MKLSLYRTAHVVVKREGEEPYVLCTMTGIQGDTTSFEIEITLREGGPHEDESMVSMFLKEAKRFQRSLKKEFTDEPRLS
jgi:hypothetical protein